MSESEKKEKKEEKARGSGGLYAHLSPFFIWAKKIKKEEEVCYERGAF